MKLPEDFETFYGKIILGATQVDRIESAANSLGEFLVNEFSLSPGEVFLQGSFPNGTAIKPDPEKKDGEYDVDLVAICAQADDDPKDALDRVEEKLKSHGTYQSMIDRDPNRPCVRLRYTDDEAGRFHVDVVPARPASGSAPLEIPRPKDGWRESAPEEYTQWCRDQGIEFARAVQMLKRWRDHNQTARQAIKSIVLQVLISNCLPALDNDAERVTNTFLGMATFLAEHEDQPPAITNPVLPSEVLTDRWDTSAYQDFRRVLDEAADKAQEALVETDFNRSRELWQELFGKDFPGPQSRGGGLTPPSPPPGERKRPQKAPRVEWG
jgi:SMODS domain-containing protein